MENTQASPNDQLPLSMLTNQSLRTTGIKRNLYLEGFFIVDISEFGNVIKYKLIGRITLFPQLPTLIPSLVV